MKHLSESKRKSMAIPLNKAIPEINKLLQKHGLQDFRVQELTLAGAKDELTCNPGYHVETYCDHLGRCYPICVKDIDSDKL